MVWPILGSRKAKEQNRTDPVSLPLLNTKLKVKMANYAQKSFNCLPHSENDLLYSESPAALRCRNSDLSSHPSSVRLPSPHGTVSPRFSEKQTHVTKLCACDQHYTLNIH